MSSAIYSFFHAFCCITDNIKEDGGRGKAIQIFTCGKIVPSKTSVIE